MGCFKDKIAIVTGGASGIGRGLCEELCKQGASVTIADINMEKAEHTVAAITATGGRVRAVSLDVTRAEEVEKLVDDMVAHYGRLDYMFNNAGIALMGEVRDMTVEQCRRLIDVNLMGVIYGSKAAYAVMIKQGHGHIVNTGSVNGLFTMPLMTHYCTTKFGVQAFSTGLRAEGADLGVKVSVICPMNIKSDIGDAIEVLNVEDENFFNNIPAKWMDTNKAAREMLRGVARNRATIVVPSRARTIWWLYRINPNIMGLMGRGGAKWFRRYRLES